MANAILFKVEYVTKIFDLTVPQVAFEFIFQVYNFFSVAEADNVHLHQPETRLAEVKRSVAQKNYPTFSHIKRRQEESHSLDTPAEGGEEDSFGNPSVVREVTRAGYTPTQPISEELTLLTPVSHNLLRCTGYLV